MKKIIIRIIALSSLSCNVLNAGIMGSLSPSFQWNGAYLGLNAGYGWSQKNTINTVGVPRFINPLFPFGTSELSNTLAVIGTNNIANNGGGFIGGGQAGYNYQMREKLMIGIDADLDGLTRPRTTTISRFVPLATFPESYNATFSARKSINWLGTLRGKIGYLLQPSLFAYGTGGLAYGEVSLNTLLQASESLGPLSYPLVVAQNNINKTRIGWNAGVGMEWMFKPQWSTKVEYSYYDLGTINSNMVLNQVNNLGVSPVLWGSANVHSSNHFVAQTLRIGLNYHFA